MKENMIWEKMKRKKIKKYQYFMRDMVDNLKKYYNIDDHIDLLKFIKKKCYKY
jgi:hypothetical protein